MNRGLVYLVLNLVVCCCVNEEARLARSCRDAARVLLVDYTISTFNVRLDTKGVNGWMEHQPLHIRHPTCSRQQHTLNVTKLKSVSRSCAA